MRANACCNEAYARNKLLLHLAALGEMLGGNARAFARATSKTSDVLRLVKIADHRELADICLFFCLSVVGARLIVRHVRGIVLAALLLRRGTRVPVSIVKRNFQSFWKI